MPSFSQAQYELIEELIEERLTRPAKMGTVEYVSPGGLVEDPGLYAASVVFDGSSGTAQPVKYFESTIIAEGDRVGLVRFEGEWIVCGNYTLRTLADVTGFYQVPSSATSTSATFVDMPGSPSALVPMKVRDSTVFRIEIAASMYADTAGSTGVELAAYVASTDGVTGYDEVLIKRFINPEGQHGDLSGGSDTAALPGGVGYAVTARWRRHAGTGLLKQDSNDSTWITVREVPA